MRVDGRRSHSRRLLPDQPAVDLESVQRIAAALARDDGYRKPLAAVCNMIPDRFFREI